MKLNKKFLTTKSKDVTFEDPARNLFFAQEMHRFMHYKKGYGLAANQVGCRENLFVMNIARPLSIFNPRLLGCSGNDLDLDYEGCLSFPKKSFAIYRPRQIEVQYQDFQGHTLVGKFESLEARCFLHEFDHLQGILPQSRVSSEIL